MELTVQNWNDIASPPLAECSFDSEAVEERSTANAAVEFAPPGVVLVAHTSDLVAAGLASTLREVKDYDVAVWDDAWRLSGARWKEAPVDIVVGDHSQVARVLAQRNEHSYARSCNLLRVVLVDDRSAANAAHLASDIPVQSVMASLTTQCKANELVDIVRRARRATRRTEAVEARGGLAPGALRRVREYIQNNMAERIELDDLAAIAGLSICHFSRAFKQSMGLPPHRYVVERRIEAAARSISDTQRPLAEIALEVGFADQSHFTRVFARVMGATPREYRRRHR
jgi:AraC-like DNA-binding protein